jgi:hypothetical protein
LRFRLAHSNGKNFSMSVQERRAAKTTKKNTIEG